ncbi:MAG: HrpJ domain-containing protein [Paracoccaceae bacterium]
MSITSARETITTQIATSNAASPVGAEVMRNAGRAPGGEGVRVSSAAADITDALEELGMAASSRAKVDLDKVKVRKGAGTDLDALGRIADYYDKLPNLPKDQQLRDLVQKFNQFEEQMRRGDRQGGRATADELRALLSQYDGDASHRFAALETIRDMAVRSGAPEAYLATLDALRAEMRAPDMAQQIVAGFHAAPEAARMEGAGVDPQDYRDAYRGMVRDTPSLGAVFARLAEFGPSEDIGDVVDSFIRTAGADMASFGPSTEPSLLGDVLSELKKLKLVRTAMDQTGVALDKLSRLHPEAELPGKADMTARLLDFAAAPVASATGAEALVAGIPETPPEMRVSALNLLTDLHAGLHDEIMPEGQRAQQSSVLQSLQDKYVGIEEAAYG